MMSVSGMATSKTSPNLHALRYHLTSMNPHHDLSRDYRDAFERYSATVRRVQQLVACPNPDAAEVDAAVLEMETARTQYIRTRNALAQLIQPALARDFSAGDSLQNREAHVRETARLLWEAGGRRDGNAPADWQRAEQILGQAAKAAQLSAS
ncbi:MAG TPA: DUF2934 domain-containing protein [Bryobacteraceae bacterium]|nr:DUF2934 domain-containing protein [Bryobacteraceae bacterium]